MPPTSCKTREPIFKTFVIGVKFYLASPTFQTVSEPEGQITPRKSRTPFLKILLFYLKILKNPFVLEKISYAIFKSELPLVGAND